MGLFTLSLAGTMAKKIADVVTREYTINLHKRVHGATFKKKAPKAIKAVRAFAQDAMKTKDVRIDTSVNKEIWSQGVRNVPRRIRVTISRKRNDNDDAEESLYSLVSIVPTHKRAF